jgi:hypothetical protein
MRPAQFDYRHNGRWYQACKEGRLFTGNAAATGLVLPIYSATAQLFGLWNPANSGVNLIVIGVRGAYVSTTGAAGGYCWGLLPNAGSNVATAAPISAFTTTTPQKGLMGGSVGGNKVFFTGSAATVTTGLMVLGRQLGINQLVLTATEAVIGTFPFSEDYDGDFCVAPGNAVFLCGNISTLTTWAPSVVWAEEALAA